MISVLDKNGSVYSHKEVNVCAPYHFWHSGWITHLRRYYYSYYYSTKKRASRASALRADGVSYTMGLVLTYLIRPIPWT